MSTALAAIDICVHATGRYVSYAYDLAESIASMWGRTLPIRMLVFTDDVDAVRAWTLTEPLTVVPVDVPHRPWPDATMRRFEDYAAHADTMTSPVVMFMDADMLVVGPLGDDLDPEHWVNGVSLVLHPGFYRPPTPPEPDAEPSVDPRPAHARGSWEDRPQSLAFVDEPRRRYYVCGGVWVAQRMSALALCAELAVRIELDAQRGVTAIWHDESHLNWWFAQYGPSLQSPEYCFVERYPQLDGLTPRIVALDKPADFVALVKGGL